MNVKEVIEDLQQAGVETRHRVKEVTELLVAHAKKAYETVRAEVLHEIAQAVPAEEPKETQAPAATPAPAPVASAAPAAK